MRSTPFADGAAALAEKGFPVFRMRPYGKIPQDRWRHGAPGQRATTDAAEIRRRARISPHANIGVATGEGHVVLDIDKHHGGIRPDWAVPTLEARTPHGGSHLYYCTDGHVQNSVGRIAPGVDVRGDGGIVAAPPSVADSGAYTWDTDPDAPMAFIPATRFHQFGQPATDGHAGRHRTRRKRPMDVRKGEVHDQVLAWAAWFASEGCDDDEVTDLTWQLVARFPFPVENTNQHIDKAIDWVLARQRSSEEVTIDHGI